MAPICLRCERHTHDVSDLYLLVVLEHLHGRLVDAVYFCGNRCTIAYLLVEGDFEPVRRQWVMGLGT
jgi:hypothetical protein